MFGGTNHTDPQAPAKIFAIPILCWWFFLVCCFLNSKNTLFLSFSQFICFLYLFLCDWMSWFKLCVSCSRAWVWSLKLFFPDEISPQVFSLVLIHALVCQTLVYCFLQKCLPPCHQKCFSFICICVTEIWSSREYHKGYFSGAS